MEGSTFDTSISGLLKGIASDIQTLIREEVALARVEVGEQIVRAKGAAVSFGIAAVALGAAGLFLLIAVALGLDDAFQWPAWAGFLAVALVLALIGIIAASAARRRLQAVHMVPEETVSTIKENSAWIAKRLTSDPK